MSDYALVYVTCPSKEEAEKILLTLLEKKLVACGNILPGVTSYFYWEGNVDKSEEFMLLLKSRSRLFSQIEACICDLHSYKTPCILQWKLDEVHSPFASWITENVK
ncbi:MAG: divalent-cation tolerance protein CutA [Pseudobdellovibrionaceae bacterium]|jgi:periplasmic divalent cation tolerance protein|nr:divalent-cation tolerance protein CutA [Pseudobdellovibrionaceae bacterium]